MEDIVHGLGPAALLLLLEAPATVTGALPHAHTSVLTAKAGTGRGRGRIRLLLRRTFPSLTPFNPILRTARLRRRRSLCPSSMVPCLSPLVRPISRDHGLHPRLRLPLSMDRPGCPFHSPAFPVLREVTRHLQPVRVPSMISPVVRMNKDLARVRRPAPVRARVMCFV